MRLNKGEKLFQDQSPFPFAKRFGNLKKRTVERTIGQESSPDVRIIVLDPVIPQGSRERIESSNCMADG